MRDLNTELKRTTDSISRWNRKLKLAMGKLTKLHNKRLRIQNKLIAEKEKLTQEAGRTLNLEAL